jgi:indolepyruvate ferredoxin oxidoreductase
MSGTVISGVGETAARPVALADRYDLDEGRVFMSGVQGLVRVLIDQHRADLHAGLHTASLVSGYQGSPLAGFDREVLRLAKRAPEHEIVMRPAVNEELGATAVWGSQLSNTLAGPRFDGVLGVWYGKAPGVDRAADAIRHGNFVGTDPRGGVLALIGDDPACKSSTLPSSSPSLLAALNVPVLIPGNIQEALDLGRHAIALSRAAGLWAALDVVTNVADTAGTVEVGTERVRPQMPVLEWEGAPYVHRPSSHLLAPQSLEMERTLVEARLPMAELYGRLNGLDRVVHDGDGRLGIVAAGATAHDVRRALADLGFADGGPVRLLQVAMLYPLDRVGIRDFAVGLDEILVVEEKGAFLETAVKEALYATAAAPRVVGKRDEHDQPLVPGHGVLDADEIARAIGRRLLAREDLPEVRAHLERLDAVASRPVTKLDATRTPFFCSGCPHNSSTVAPDGEVVGAGIGCHTMILLAPKGHGEVTGITQMGGEGAQWIGAAPFVEVGHFTQNLGDGTFHHSGSLAIRAAVAANLDVTYKLLFNGTVAMTGGQHVEGQMSVVEAARSLAAEGVKRIVITTEEPADYRDVDLPATVEVHGRREILQLQRELAKVEGVTALIHDQACAAELRRARKRGKAAEPPQRVLINERVCEGCGDCGEKSACLSVEPVETEFGRKTRINQTSCNKDFSCLEGDCPSFLTVIPQKGGEQAAPRLPDFELPRPAPVAEASSLDVRVRIVGIGGTGVVTVSQVLGVAAMLDGLQASGLDQTGLSQKAGPVVSDIRITAEPVADGVTVPSAAADVLLGLDLVTTTTPRNLRVADPERTVAVVSDSVVPTAQMIVDPDAASPRADVAREAIDAVTDAGRSVYLDAQLIAERLLGDTTTANVVVLGAAWQAGLLPVTLEALEQAFELNGVAVELNLASLAWGRAWVVDPEVVRGKIAGVPSAVKLGSAEQELLDGATPEEGELRRLLAVRIADLVGWGGRKPAVELARQVGRVGAIEAERAPGQADVTKAFAAGYHKLLAYKDEYEVARLHLEALTELPPGSKLKFHLHPPLLRALGMKRKLQLGRWFVPAFRVLRRSRRLRGTPFDPFGYAEVRRVERALPAEYLGLVDAALERLSPETLATVVEVARLPELVRGYEDIKLANVERFRTRGADLLAELGGTDR